MKYSIKVTFVLLLGIMLPAAVAAPAAEVVHHDAEAIRKAGEGVRKAAPLAAAEPNRPVYHFLPEAQWINDPNGCFYADGWYHVFYQHNPYGYVWGHMHWGHARSRDNVIWERMPVAVWPSTEKGEDHCYSGSAVRDGDGNLQLWYTSVSNVRPKDKDKGGLQWVFNGQVMLKPMDKDFIKWGKTTDDPVNKPNLPNNIDGYAWNTYIRDPAFFEADGRTFMLLGITGTPESGGHVAPIYEAKNKGLTEWEYRGTMYDDARDCPQMIPFTTEEGKQKWMYVLSSGAPPRYYVGTFDPDTAKFTKETAGKLDEAGNFNTISFLTDSDGRHIVYSWITGTKGKNWNNCFAIPRVLTLGADGHPVQKPVPELAKLRGKHVRVKDITGAKVLDIKGDALEIDVVFEDIDKGDCGLRVRRSEDGTRALEIRCRNNVVNIFGTHVRIEPEGERNTLRLQVFLDKTIMEVFVNGGRKTATRVMHPPYPPVDDLGIEVLTDGKASADVWQLKSIWTK